MADSMMMREEEGGELRLRRKTGKIASSRPLSVATEIHDTDFEDESDFEEYSPKGSFDTDARRTSQTTLSSYDEVHTPNSSDSRRRFDLTIQPVQGPRGPHLFRASQSSSDFQFDYAMQMSPLLPKEPILRTDTAFSDETITPVTRQRQLEQDYSIATALHKALNSPPVDEANRVASIRNWTHEQVIDWMLSANLDAAVIDSFEYHDVDGAVLMDIQFGDLKELDIQSFGKRHQVWSALCELRGEDMRPSPLFTPFEDISRPCTTTNRRSPSQSRANGGESPADAEDVTSPASQTKKRRGRKAPKHLDVVTPGESVSIVAIEQLVPKPHKCAKGERCAKWRKQQRELQQLKDDDAIGRFPISPGMGGRIVVRGDPGNSATADNIIPNVHLLRVDDNQRPASDAIPSVVASSDVLGPGQMPEFALDPSVLEQLEKRDPQDNVRQFLSFQHLQSPAPPVNDAPPTPPTDVFGSISDPVDRSMSVPPLYQNREPVKRSESVPPLFPEQHFQPYPSLHPQQQAYAPHNQLRHLPRLSIPNVTTPPEYDPATATAVPQSGASSVCRSLTASPQQIVSPSNLYRYGTPASDVDVPVTAVPTGPIARNTSASVPPNMQYRQQHNISRSQSRAAEWRRPSMALPAVQENEVFSPIEQPVRSSSDSKVPTSTVRDPAHHSPTTQQFGYGSDCTHAGWMKKRKTKMLRHEWQDAHFRLRGTELGMYPNARLSSAAMDHINVDDYAIACSSTASNSKISAAIKALKIFDDNAAAKKAKDGADPTAFAFQLVPTVKEGESKKLAVANGKTHHFAVKSKDERIDWMRELMLAKALKQKGEGYDVEVYGDES